MVMSGSSGTRPMYSRASQSSTDARTSTDYANSTDKREEGRSSSSSYGEEWPALVAARSSTDYTDKRQEGKGGHNLCYLIVIIYVICEICGKQLRGSGVAIFPGVAVLSLSPSPDGTASDPVLSQTEPPSGRAFCD